MQTKRVVKKILPNQLTIKRNFVELVLEIYAYKMIKNGNIYL